MHCRLNYYMNHKNIPQLRLLLERVAFLTLVLQFPPPSLYRPARAQYSFRTRHSDPRPFLKKQDALGSGSTNKFFRKLFRFF